MAEKSYEIVEAYISRYPGDDRIVFADNRLKRNEIFRGQAKKWKGFTNNDGFIEFLKTNNISSETQIAIAQDGPDAFAVIQIINFLKEK